MRTHTQEQVEQQEQKKVETILARLERQRDRWYWKAVLRNKLGRTPTAKELTDFIES